MRRLCICVGGILLCSLFAFPQTERQPIPPGIQKAMEKRQIPTEAGPAARKKPASAQEIRQEAEEMAALAQTIPQDMEQVIRGLHPRDLEKKLRRLEKLSKQLRAVLQP